MSMNIYMQNTIDDLEFKLDEEIQRNWELSNEVDDFRALLYDWILPHCRNEIIKSLFVKGVIEFCRENKLEKEANGLEKAMDKEARFDTACGPFGEDLQD